MDTFKENDIFKYIRAMEAQYKKPIDINDGWHWNMADHIKQAVLYKNTQFEQGNTKSERDYKPMKNIVRPILNVQYRAEGFDVKDVQLYIDDSDQYYKSLLVKKYHEKWARENKLDTFIDELVESYVDFGGALVKNVNNVRPEVVPLPSIAFCDQTDILSGPIAIKHYFSPDQLLEMADKGWGSKTKGATITLEDLITLSRNEKQDTDGTKAETPGRYIEIYEVHGNLPKRYVTPSDTSEKFETRLFIVAFYQKQGGSEQGVILYTNREPVSPFKFLKRDPIFGRALGFGGVEELVEPQVWINYSLIRMQHMLDAAASSIIVTNDPALRQKHPTGFKDMSPLEIVDEAPEGNTRMLDTFPRNLKLFENAVAEWEMHAQQMGAANDSIMGEQPASGTPFKLQELVTAESHSLHEYRKGKIATFLEEIYNDWTLEHIGSEITKGQEFLAELDMDELQYVADAIVQCQINDKKKELFLKGEIPDDQEMQLFEQVVRDTFMQGGKKRFMQIFKAEMADVSISVKVNIVGKQKYLAQQVDKIVNILRFVISSNPMALASKGTWDLINQVVELSGLDPVDFSDLAAAMKNMQQAAMTPQQLPPAQDQGTPSPITPTMATATA